MAVRERDLELKRTESSILARLTPNTSKDPASLLQELEDRGLSRSTSRVAIWYLIGRNEIELTDDRKLRLAIPLDGR